MVDVDHDHPRGYVLANTESMLINPEIRREGGGRMEVHLRPSSIAIPLYPDTGFEPP